MMEKVELSQDLLAEGLSLLEVHLLLLEQLLLDVVSSSASLLVQVAHLDAPWGT